MTWVLEADNGNTRTFDSRSEAEQTKAELEEIGATVELSKQTVADGGTATVPEETATHHVEESVNAIETVKESGLDTDPLNVLPGFMVDSIKGEQAVNKHGYAMIAERYNIEVTTEMVQSPWDNDEGRVVCKATATTDDGKTYNAYGTACEADDDDRKNLIELADTRSQKRAIQWASGFGIVGYQELTGQLEDDR